MGCFCWSYFCDGSNNFRSDRNTTTWCDSQRLVLLNSRSVGGSWRRRKCWWCSSWSWLSHVVMASAHRHIGTNRVIIATGVGNGWLPTLCKWRHKTVHESHHSTAAIEVATASASASTSRSGGSRSSSSLRLYHVAIHAICSWA